MSLVRRREQVEKRSVTFIRKSKKEWGESRLRNVKKVGVKLTVKTDCGLG